MEQFYGISLKSKVMRKENSSGNKVEDPLLIRMDGKKGMALISLADALVFINIEVRSA